MIIILWVVLTPVVLGLLGFGIYLLKAVVQGYAEGLRYDPEAEETAASVARRTADLGLLSAERQNTKLAAPLSPALTVALAEARAGDWEPGASLLDETARTRDWERRAWLAYHLGLLAAEDDAWLLSWESARPDDPGAALVRARSTVCLAWNLRGAKRAKFTSAEQFAGFQRTLPLADDQHARAAKLAPADDPCPYIGMIWSALGLGRGHEEMRRIWEEITRRAPHHYQAHWTALQFWSAKWRGSEELARAFATKAAAGAPEGSLMTVFPLIAHFEHDTSDDTEVDRTPEMYAAVDAVLADVAAADPDHPRLAEVRHVLAYYLDLQGRWDEAVEQFRQVDGHVGALPWSYRADPAEHYCRTRDECVANAS
ncbi:hypothetical protein [Streptomyces beihaiensis]|uniref:DUF4034 domain-containing protein n=1 Tax=Streptomyces beihaiensis TaxID=2984495 RepID=A0ABT3TN27_9ACTN|nr:hypothetical protein [Streptomyces beihaiensis]MCX3058397.1 hypothetical protein [Streptomyces beihaiensis]